MTAPTAAPATKNIRLAGGAVATIVGAQPGAERLLGTAQLTDALIDAAQRLQVASVEVQWNHGLDEDEWPTDERARVMELRATQTACAANLVSAFGELDAAVREAQRYLATVPASIEQAFAQLWATVAAYETGKQDVLQLILAVDDAQATLANLERAAYTNHEQALTDAGQKVTKVACEAAVENDAHVIEYREHLRQLRANKHDAETDLSIRRQRMLTTRVIAVLKFGQGAALLDNLTAE